MNAIDFSLQGKRICVTGASSGIGAALGEYFASQGAKVVAVARREAPWDDGETSASVQADLSDLNGLAEVATEIAKPFGDIDVLFNAAGLNPRIHADDLTPKDWAATLDINLGASFFLAQAFVPAMKAKGWGRIVNFASLQSGRAFENGLAYGASKGGVAQLTRAMAQAWSSSGITCNALAPGFFPTELTGPVFADSELAAKNAAQTAIGRNGALEDMFGPAQFLASRASDYVTGQILYVDGGFTAK